MGRPDEAELLRRAEAARAVRIRSPLGDESKAADARLRELTEERDLQVRAARQRAWVEWQETGPGQPRFGQRRRLAWRRAQLESVDAAEYAARRHYNTTYLQAHGEDFDELVRAASEESQRLRAERRAEIRAADQEIAAVIKAVHRELKWNLDRIARRLWWLEAREVRAALGLPEPRHLPRSRSSGSGGDFAGFGCGSGCGGGGGGGGE